MINSILKTSPKLINDHLAIIISNSENLLNSKIMTNEQLNRLKQLDEKYNLTNNYKNRFND